VKKAVKKQAAKKAPTARSIAKLAPETTPALPTPAKKVEVKITAAKGRCLTSQPFQPSMWRSLILPDR